MPVYIFADHQIKFIQQSVQSILNQSYENWELIIVDDGSGISYKHVIPEDSRIKYFEIEHAGTARARNFGLSKATGDYYTAQDSDDCSAPNRLEKMVKALEDKKADVVYSDFYVCSIDGLDTRLRQPSETVNLQALMEIQSVPYFVMVRMDKIVKYRDRYMVNDDWMFIVDLCASGAKFTKINEPLLIYRLNPLSVTKLSVHGGVKAKEEKWLKSDFKKIYEQKVLNNRGKSATTNKTRQRV